MQGIGPQQEPVGGLETGLFGGHEAGEEQNIRRISNEKNIVA